MAGGALGGALGAALRLFPSFREDWIQTPFYSNEPISQSVSAILFIGICVYVWLWSTKRAKEEQWIKQGSTWLTLFWALTRSGAGRDVSLRYRPLYCRFLVLR